ncbi:TraG/VirB4 family ATPase [Piscirickettsia litoralis]|uniref:TraG P-loop domain-containing protein n=1 Tax=Piscirickettsia litoralis TaxID=1891921 RepID=A0ABX3A172_9GAMM|nr:DUF87 domain-containing protein [Piscirickettsia litoralis]ODN41378.1 hypothetical protein BGC07_16545 [Piscirickettsia litoralis]
MTSKTIIIDEQWNENSPKTESMLKNHNKNKDAPAIIASSPPMDFNLTNLFNKEDKTASNMLITGESGAGKTFELKTLIKKLSSQGAKVLILDVGHSFAELVAKLGGQTIQHPFTSNFDSYCHPVFTSLLEETNNADEFEQHSTLIAELVYYIAGGNLALQGSFENYKNTLVSIVKSAFEQYREPNFISNLIFACEEMSYGNKQASTLFERLSEAEANYQKIYSNKRKIDFSQDIIHIGDNHYFSELSKKKNQFAVFLCFLALRYRLANPQTPIVICIDEIIRFDAITHLLPLINTYQVSVVATSQPHDDLEKYKKEFQCQVEVTAPNGKAPSNRQHLQVIRTSA